MEHPPCSIDILQEGPKSHPGGPKRPPRGSQESPSDASIGSPWHPRRSKTPLGTPRSTQDAPSGLQTASERHPRRLREAFKRLLAILLAFFLILLIIIFIIIRIFLLLPSPSSPSPTSVSSSSSPPSNDYGCPPLCCYTSLITSARLGVVPGWAGRDTRSVKHLMTWAGNAQNAHVALGEREQP